HDRNSEAIYSAFSLPRAEPRLCGCALRRFNHRCRSRRSRSESNFDSRFRSATASSAVKPIIAGRVCPGEDPPWVRVLERPERIMKMRRRQLKRLTEMFMGTLNDG